jgi:CarD family transcriptional regulator
MFQVGDKILHPLHGVGTVESVKSQEVLGEIKDYFVVELTLRKMKVMVPVDKCVEIGVRRITNSGQIDEIFTILKSRKTSEMPANWNRRYKHNLDKIKTGDIKEAAEVLRNLRLKEKRKGLSMGEKKMLDNVRQLILGEVAYSKNLKMDEASVMLEKVMH